MQYLQQESRFTKVFGNGSYAKIIQFFVANKNTDYSISDVADKTGIGRTTLHAIIPKLLDEGIITKTRDVGPSKLFKLNTVSETVKQLLKLYTTMEE